MKGDLHDPGPIGIGYPALPRRRLLDSMSDTAKEWAVLAVGLLYMVAAFVFVGFWVATDERNDDQRSRIEGRRWAEVNEATVTDCERRAVDDALDLYDVNRSAWFDGCRAVAAP